MKLPPWNILVLPGGSECGLEINRALRDCKEINLFSAGMVVSSPAEVRFATHCSMPSVAEHGWLEALNAIISRHEIDFVYPAHDDVVLALAEHREHISAIVVTSPLETCRIARSKAKTYAALSGAVPVPLVYEAPEEADFPVFVKPDRGQGSQRARIVHNKELLLQALSQENDLLVAEFLPGLEYTVDCFSDRERGLLHVSPRERRRVKAGISMHTTPCGDQDLFALASGIAERLKFHGAWFFQARRDKSGQAKILEVAPRVSGSMALSRVQGVNFPLLSLYEECRIPVTVSAAYFSVELNRSLDNHYRTDLSYSSVYVDLDDTLVNRKGMVNTRIVRFLFQCVNCNKRLVLLTKHRGNLGEVLEKCRLGGIFDQVIQLDNGADKADFISEPDAIFIDDSFSERLKLAMKGYRTFDPSSIECLIDDRA